MNPTRVKNCAGVVSIGSNLPCQAEGQDNGGEGKSIECRGIKGMPTPSSSVCCFGTNSVTFDTQHMPIQWEAPILICFNGQGLPTVLNRERKEGGSSMTAHSRVNAFKDIRNAPSDQYNGSTAHCSVSDGADGRHSFEG